MTNEFYQESFSGEEEFDRPGSGEGFWPLVRSVVAVGGAGAGPRFRVVGPRLRPEAARTAARRVPGVFVRGTQAQVRNFAHRVGGELVGPEQHGPGLPHYHLIRPDGDRIHIWYGQRVPESDFFE
jgi:hypothetical protein